MVYGPSGSGKKTRIVCLLRELYGTRVEKLRIEHQTFLAPSKKKLEISTVASNYHIEVNPRFALGLKYFVKIAWFYDLTIFIIRLSEESVIFYQMSLYLIYLYNIFSHSARSESECSPVIVFIYVSGTLL